MVILLIVIAIIGPFIAPYPYQQQDLKAVVANGNKALPPGSPGHILGTDVLGRDLLSRLAGRRPHQHVGGAHRPGRRAAHRRTHRRDRGLGRWTDRQPPDALHRRDVRVPGHPLHHPAVGRVPETAFGKALDGLLLVFVAIGLTIWVTVARLVRGQMLALKETEFVEAAQAIGVRDRTIITRHLLPNGMGPVIVAVTLGIPAAILAEATLAFLGIGVQAPRASWGSLIEGYRRSACIPTSYSSRRSVSPSPSSASRSSGTACATRSIRSSRKQ